MQTGIHFYAIGPNDCHTDCPQLFFWTNEAKGEKKITGKVKDSPRHDSLTDVVTEFEVCRQQFLRFGVNLGLWVVGDGRGVEEVEKGVVLDRLRDGPDVAL